MAIIGGGICGVMAGARCVRDGISFVILERGDRFGGNWVVRANSYSHLQVVLVSTSRHSFELLSLPVLDRIITSQKRIHSSYYQFTFRHTQRCTNGTKTLPWTRTPSKRSLAEPSWTPSQDLPPGTSCRTTHGFPQRCSLSRGERMTGTSCRHMCMRAQPMTTHVSHCPVLVQVRHSLQECTNWR